MDILAVKSVSKSFGASRVLKDVEFKVQESEIYFVLGPSGCGKTTLLRIITGFLAPDRGRVFLAGRDITGTAPAQRNIGMVFQNYALWPHMSVWQNITYGLEIKKMSAEAIKGKTDRVLDITKLTSHKNMFPPNLSGGQQQRVALARAIITEPRVLLLDEPLSNLDAKLREEMRSEIKRIQRETKITMIYVTHDQKEAMALGHRITVMDEGRIIQTGTPLQLYAHPHNKFVASFLGDVNILKGRIVGTGDFTEVLTQEGRFKAKRNDGFNTGDSVEIVFRPESVIFGQDINSMSCRISDVEYYGETFRVSATTKQGSRFQLKSFPRDMKKFKKDDIVRFSVAPEDITIFKEQ